MAQPNALPVDSHSDSDDVIARAITSAEPVKEACTSATVISSARWGSHTMKKASLIARTAVEEENVKASASDLALHT